MTAESASPEAVSERSRAVALVLAGVLGTFGAHRFYVGKNGTGVLMIFTLGGLGLWYLYDLILVAAGEFRDAEDQKVSRWSQFEPEGLGLQRRGQHEELSERLDALRSEVGELAERLDFAERMLAKQRERDALPPGRGS